MLLLWAYLRVWVVDYHDASGTHDCGVQCFLRVRAVATLHNNPSFASCLEKRGVKTTNHTSHLPVRGGGMEHDEQKDSVA